VVYGLISRRRQQAGGPPAQRAPPDLLQALLESRDEDGSGMGDEALRDELMTLMVGARAAWRRGAAPCRWPWPWPWRRERLPVQRPGT
jgi:cytochrome P450